MNLSAKLKSFGNRNVKAVILNVPETAACLTKYELDIVEYPFGFTTVFVSQNNEDVLSKTFNTNNPSGIKEAFREIVEYFKEDKSLPESTQGCV